MRFKLHKNHPINKLGRSPNDKINHWLYKWEVNNCDYVIIATEYGEEVGCFRFDIDRNTLLAIGTWVSKSYRGKGIATKLWDKAIEKFKPNKIEVNTTTRGGVRLVWGLAKKYKNIKFDGCNMSGYGPSISYLVNRTGKRLYI